MAVFLTELAFMVLFLCVRNGATYVIMYRYESN